MSEPCDACLTCHDTKSFQLPTSSLVLCPSCQIILARQVGLSRHVINHVLLQMLGELMSEVSEECWCADWQVPVVCRLAVKGLTPFPGRWHVSLDKATVMTALAKEVGCWAKWTDEGYVKGEVL